MNKHLVVDLARQSISVLDHGEILNCYAISTALNGPGEWLNSGCTPRGLHYIRALIGQNKPENTVFRGRRATGEIYSEQLARKQPDRDWILTRILWLSGLEQGVNRLGQLDTFRRYIYIHGTPDSEPMGVPQSHGCIRMRNTDIIALFEQCFFKMLVRIS